MLSLGESRASYPRPARAPHAASGHLAAGSALRPREPAGRGSSARRRVVRQETRFQLTHCTAPGAPSAAGPQFPNLRNGGGRAFGAHPGWGRAGGGPGGAGPGLAGGRGRGPSARWRQRRVRALDRAVSAEGAGRPAGDAGTAADGGLFNVRAGGGGLAARGAGGRRRATAGSPKVSGPGAPGSAARAPEPQPGPGSRGWVRRMGPAALGKGAPCW